MPGAGLCALVGGAQKNACGGNLDPETEKTIIMVSPKEMERVLSNGGKKDAPCQRKIAIILTRAASANRVRCELSCRSGGPDREKGRRGGTIPWVLGAGRKREFVRPQYFSEPLSPGGRKGKYGRGERGGKQKSKVKRTWMRLPARAQEVEDNLALKCLEMAPGESAAAPAGRNRTNCLQ